MYLQILVSLACAKTVSSPLFWRKGKGPAARLTKYMYTVDPSQNEAYSFNFNRTEQVPLSLPPRRNAMKRRVQGSTQC